MDDFLFENRSKWDEIAISHLLIDGINFDSMHLKVNEHKPKLDL